MIPIRDHNPSRHRATVTWGIIALNVAIHTWVWATVTTDAQMWSMMTDWALFPVQISRGQDLHTLISGVFLHADWLHLAGNMLFLWIFGDNLEDEMGHGGFAAFYLAAGVGAGLAQWGADPQSFVPMVGASGAIAGVMGAYLVLFPRAQVDMFFVLRIVPVPAWLMLALWFVVQLASGVGSAADAGGVAYWAHAGGFIVGAVLIVPLFLRRGGRAFWARNDGHAPHAPATYGALSPSAVPQVKRADARRRPWG